MEVDDNGIMREKGIRDRRIERGERLWKLKGEDIVMLALEDSEMELKRL